MWRLGPSHLKGLPILIGICLLACLPAQATEAVELGQVTSSPAKAERLDFGAKPFVAQGTVLVPLRGVAEWLGARVLQQGVGISIYRDGGSSPVVWLRIGETADIYGTPTGLSIPPVVVADRTYVPLRFIAEYLGAAVNYDAGTRTITLQDGARAGTLLVPQYPAAEQRRYETLVRQAARTAAAHAEQNRLAPLFEAAQRNDTSALARLLSANPKLLNARDGSGGTPLHCAPTQDARAAVEFLLARGAKVDARSGDGSTPLFYASAATALILIAHGANVNAKAADGTSALHCAAAVGNLEAAKLLLAKGAKANASDGEGRTPLHEAARSNEPAVAKLLLSKGAKVNAKTDMGCTPLAFANALFNDAVAEVLKAHGGVARGKVLVLPHFRSSPIWMP